MLDLDRESTGQSQNIDIDFQGPFLIREGASTEDIMNTSAEKNAHQI